MIDGLTLGVWRTDSRAWVTALGSRAGEVHRAIGVLRALGTTLVVGISNVVRWAGTCASAVLLAANGIHATGVLLAGIGHWYCKLGFIQKC